MKIQGRAVLVVGPDGRFIDDIDTDQIFHNRFLTITDQREMGAHAFSSLDGWQDYPDRAKEGDILICGENFGAGSSRQQAVGCFQALGVAAIVARSFASIYFRNAVNAAMPVVQAQGIGESMFQTGDRVEIDLVTGEIVNLESGLRVQGVPASTVQLEIIQAGGLLELAG
jgi:3-isopropylmalate/(R)-2-methylmalate dehydratase small subunit